METNLTLVKQTDPEMPAVSERTVPPMTPISSLDELVKKLDLKIVDREVCSFCHGSGMEEFEGKGFRTCRCRRAKERARLIEKIPERNRRFGLPELATLAPFMTARGAPRVAFSELVERGMISPGTKLVDAKKKIGALVRADGAIMLGDKVGSIHRMGALAQGSEACNGWTYWHVETKKGLRLIDELRAEIRIEMAAAG